MTANRTDAIIASVVQINVRHGGRKFHARPAPNFPDYYHLFAHREASTPITMGRLHSLLRRVRRAAAHVVKSP